MGIARKTLYFLIALPLAVLTLYVLVQLWPERCDAPITCETDLNCGGNLELKRSCRGMDVYAEGQRNTCTQPGTCQASCQTAYEPWLIETCANGCELGKCL